MKTKFAGEIIFVAYVLMLTLAGTMASAQNRASSAVALFTSKPYVSRDAKAQTFNDSITLAPGQENLPMALIVNNGNPTGKPFSWFRLQINGEMMATEKDLRGNQVDLDVTGRMFPATSQVICQAGGVPGASLTWSVITNRVSLVSANPVSVIAGGQLTLTGSNFSSTSSQNVVYFNSKPGQVLSSTPTSMTVKTPADVQQGTQQVYVAVNGLNSNAITVTVGGYQPPVMTSLNYMELPPGELLTIRGQRFAESASDNHVFFGDREAQIVASSPTKITVIAPQWSFGPQSMNIPVRVVSHGVPSTNALPVDLGNLFIAPQLPPMPGDAGP